MGKKMVPSRCLFQKLSFTQRTVTVCVSSQKLAVMQLERQDKTPTGHLKVKNISYRWIIILVLVKRFLRNPKRRQYNIYMYTWYISDI